MQELALLPGTAGSGTISFKKNSGIWVLWTALAHISISELITEARGGKTPASQEESKNTGLKLNIK